MKILYITNSRIPTEKAHGIQIMKTCEALKRAGHEVTLVVPFRFNPIKDDPFTYYHLETRFPIQRLFSIDLVSLGKFGFLFQSFTFALSACVYVLTHSWDVIYSRDEYSMYFISLFTKKFFWEVHDGVYNFVIAQVVRRARGLIAITNNLKQFYTSKGKNAEDITVIPDGVDLKVFNQNIASLDKKACRARLRLPLDKKLVTYTGHLYGWKGVDILAKAAHLVDADTEVLFIGGTPDDIKMFTAKYKNVPTINILGKKPHTDMPLYLKASDIVVIPNSGLQDISKFYTSPIKLFEYMASGTPIIASDLPSIREILNESNALMTPADNPETLAQNIKKLLHDETRGEKLAQQALKDVRRYSWEERAKNIIQAISKK